MEHKDEEVKIVFKKRRKAHKNLRSVPKVEDEKRDSKGDDGRDEDSIDWQSLDELKLMQRAKRRVTKGINILDLNCDGNKPSVASAEKPMGGLTDANTLASELDLGNTFSLETNRRDEDAELMKYVEEELAKRRSNPNEGDSLNNSGRANLTDDMLLKVIPENLLKLMNESKSKNEEMLSSQMLSGIPEVNLGIEERIRNIEKTEAARAKLFDERLQQQDSGKRSRNERDTSFVPKNLASCFTRNNNMIQQACSQQNHRFNMNSVSSENKDLLALFNKKDDKKSLAGKQPQQHQQQPNFDIEPVVRIGDEPQKVRLPKPMERDRRMPGKDKPTDDYIFEKFKKHIKKY